MTATITHLRVATPRRSAPVVPPMNVHAYVHTILEAANSLLRNDYEVIAFQADIVSKTPILWLKDCPHVRELVRVGIASYDRTGADDTGAYRVGVFSRCGVTVQWLERVPA
ncbi:MAG: hypothetical protein A3H93_09080 [Rhodocyclales bacterium RIFCSPLOWO2_02_FULL_63_24]|nr:MAG: hypothetical protein A3H93_09080 [Rhodocyclales bacterium RIFCSPLOWO2_02_FULL_63_24]